uniref:Uncharacterized protein n=1 Tax=Oryza nivara TaxID=4536 RepID=A0A0E0HDS1_ORYNI
MAPSSSAKTIASTLSRSSPRPGQDLAIGGEELHKVGFLSRPGRRDVAAANCFPMHTGQRSSS